MNSKGQSLLEAVFSVFVMLQFFTVFCLCFYTIFLSAWIPHILYELNICKISYPPSTQCETLARQHLNTILWNIPYEISTYRMGNKQGCLLRLKLSDSALAAAPATFREELEL